MSTTATYLAFTGAASLVLLSLACSGKHRASTAAPVPAPAVAAATADEAAGPEIVRIVGRHPTIIVTAGPNGPRYSARDDEGRMIVANATLDELWTSHPHIARFVDPALALDANASEPPDREPRSFRGSAPEYEGGSIDAIDARR